MNYVKHIINFLLAQDTTFHSFKASTFGDEDDIPHCNFSGEPWPIDTVSIDAENPNKVCLCVDKDGYIFYDSFDGTENTEVFKTVFEQIYAERAETDTMDNWLEISEEQQLHLWLPEEAIKASVAIITLNAYRKVKDAVLKKNPLKMEVQITQVCDCKGYIDINSYTVTEVWQNEGILKVRLKEIDKEFSLVNSSNLYEDFHWDIENLCEVILNMVNKEINENNK